MAAVQGAIVSSSRGNMAVFMNTLGAAVGERFVPYSYCACDEADGWAGVLDSSLFLRRTHLITFPRKIQ